METVAKKKPRPRRSFTPEFKADMMERCQGGDRTVAQVARDFDLAETAVRKWVNRRPSTLAVRTRRTTAGHEVVEYDPRSRSSRRVSISTSVPRTFYGATTWPWPRRQGVTR